jgi:phosphoribosylamine--glycine ligase
MATNSIMMKKRILLVGSGAREHSLAMAIARSPQQPELLVFASSHNPGVAKLAQAMTIGSITDGAAVVAWAKEQQATLALIGPEAPLESGVADALWDAGIPVVGPRKTLAQLETSKAFTRDLLRDYGIGGCPAYRNFQSMDGVADFLKKLGEYYVIKANGLMGGKGVKVAGDHLHSHAEAIAFCQELIDGGGEFVIEHKMVGVEFSLISLCGGKTLLHFPAVQDHKRAHEGDKGPNTGGMGTYTDADHSLPFLSDADIADARAFNERVAAALLQSQGQPYRGVLYGGFMATKDGTMIVEYNARFGDPECLNLMTLLEADFVALLEAVIADRLDNLQAVCSPKASVCKYVVPDGYPDNPIKGFALDVTEVEGVDLYLGSVDLVDGKLVGTGSRTAAVVATAGTIAEAEALAEVQINRIKGPVFHRRDIGTAALLNERIEMMRKLRS